MPDENERTIKTVIHAYHFDVHKEADSWEYHELKERLKGLGLKCFESWGGGGSHWLSKLDGREVELELTCLFENQWNTAPVEGFSDKGLRVFDWAQDYFNNRSIKQGHWLEQTDEMREVRRNTVKCGYCGKQEPAAKGYVFCPHCLDSEYLGEKDLRLTRLRPVDRSREEFQELSQAELDYLLPLYREAQLHGSTERGKARLIKQRRDIVTKAAQEVENATNERDGMLWLLDHGIRIDNVIYYNHTGVFTFGWRQPVPSDVRSGLLDLLVEFPFAYEIKSEVGNVATRA